MKFQRAQRGGTAIYSLVFTLRTRGLAGELQLDPIEHKPEGSGLNPAGVSCVPFLRGYGAKDRPSGSRREHHPRGERGGVAVGPARRHSPNRTIASAPGAGMSAARAAPGDDRLDHDQDVYSRRAGLHAVAGGPGRAGPDDRRLGSLARPGALFLVAQDCAARGRSRQRQQRFGRSSNATEDRRTRTRPAGGRIERHGKEARARATARRRRRTPRRRRAAFCRPCSS
jgi:hypothetical protein